MSRTREMHSKIQAGFWFSRLLLASFVALLVVIAPASSAFAGSQAETAKDDENPSTSLVASPNTLETQDDATDADIIASGVSRTCAWSIDNNGHLKLAPVNGNEGQMAQFTMPPWSPYASQIKSVSVEGTIKSVQCVNLFFNCTALASVDLRGLDTSGEVSFLAMFEGCTSLESVDLSMLNTQRVDSMDYMFNGCTSLKQVNLSGFDTSALRSFHHMFNNCPNLSSLDLSSFDTSSVNNAHDMFNGCSSLQKVIVGEKWALKTPQESSYMYNMFTKCHSLVGANGTSFADVQISDSTYARIDTAETPGYFWSADSKPATVSLAKATVTLSKRTFVYSGKVCTPTVKVQLGDETLTNGEDYTLTFSKGRKDVGTYTVFVKGKGAYSSVTSATFRIIPQNPTISKLVAHKNSDGSSGFIVTWKKPAESGIGYKLQWSSSRSFSTVEAFSFASTSPYASKGEAPLKVRNMQWRGKYVYVRVCAFQNVDGIAYHSSWSPARRVILKK